MNFDTLEIEPDDIDIALPTVTPPAEAQIPLVITAADIPLPLMQVLPSDLPLPILTKFIPDVQLRHAAETATAYALGLDVAGAEGLQRTDLALTTLRGSLKAITEHFADPVDIAHRLHRRLTEMRGDWTKAGEAAVRAIGQRVYAEQQRLQRLADAERRAAQEEANRQAREKAAQEAQAAAKAKAPAPVVQELERRAQTATAPPVPTSPASPILSGLSTVTTWKARPKGTPADAEPNPKVAEMEPRQLEHVRVFLAAIFENNPAAPIAAIDINWRVLNDRAKADKKTFSIPGFESFEEGSVRAKGRRV